MIDIFTKTGLENDLPHSIVQLGGNSYPISHDLATVMEDIKPGMCSTVFWATDGNWSMIDMFIALLKKFSPCDVTLSSYAFSEKPARIFADMKEQGVIKNLHCIIDSRVDVRAASALTLIQNAADRCVLCDTHAKVTLLYNGTDHVSVIGSANYTANKRYEAGIITDLPNVYNFYYEWIQLAMDRRNIE